MFDARPGQWMASGNELGLGLEVEGETEQTEADAGQRWDEEVNALLRNLESRAEAVTSWTEGGVGAGLVDVGCEGEEGVGALQGMYEVAARQGLQGRAQGVQQMQHPQGIVGMGGMEWLWEGEAVRTV
jgi:hypothetical protein